MRPVLWLQRRNVICIGLMTMCCACFGGSRASAQVLDRGAILGRQVDRDNRDDDWFLENIPFFDCPDSELVVTYYYRWELMTKHLTYGSPESGYVFTEFIDRPFWSGAYGAISCPAGHQLYEARWLRSPQIANDYSRYWFETPGAQPRNYSTWLADSVLAVDRVHPNRELCRQLLPKLIANFEGWKQRHYVESEGLFWQTGHDDGMEYNIASRQTQDLLRGAPSYRPSFNAYMWAEANAIAELSLRLGDEDTSRRYRHFSDGLKERIMEKLWDPKRKFFLAMFRDNEHRDGYSIAAGSLIYEMGEFAGDSHGRELIGYVPWQFGMVEPNSPYDIAWAKLMDRNGFFAEYGPSTVERNDPMFLLQKSCCWWSGQSWPYATTQTLKAMANHLQQGTSSQISNDDFVQLLQIYSKSHRKDGKPYLAEALHPDTGSFEGHDGYNHSEHYFHSGFVDLIITGLVGLIPSDDGMLTIHPLAPSHWDYFALEGVRYRGGDLCIFWDKTGDRYLRGAGLSILYNGAVIGSSTELKPIRIELPNSNQQASFDLAQAHRSVNHLVNNDGNNFPRVTASSTAPGSSLAKLQDGNYWYMKHPPNRWVSEVGKETTHWIEIDFGKPRKVDELKLYFLDDAENQSGSVAAPKSVRMQIWQDGSWVDPKVSFEHNLVGHRPTTISIGKNSDKDFSLKSDGIQKIRLECIGANDRSIGLTEIEAWGPASRPYDFATPPAGNLAYRVPGADYPRALASHSDRFGGIPANANDGKCIFAPNPMNRWTSYESPSASDWLEFQFEKRVRFHRVELAIYDDRGGVQPPKDYAIEYWETDHWQPVVDERHDPAVPTGGVWNRSDFGLVTSDRVRIVFQHALPAKSGVTEVMISGE